MEIIKEVKDIKKVKEIKEEKSKFAEHWDVDERFNILIYEKDGEKNYIPMYANMFMSRRQFFLKYAKT